MNPLKSTTINDTYGHGLLKKGKDISRLLFNNIIEIELSSEAHTIELFYDYMIKNEIPISDIV